jgi:hypothetical protein
MGNLLEIRPVGAQLFHADGQTDMTKLTGYFYVLRIVHFGIKFYNDQRNAQVFNLFVYLLLP